MATLVGGLVGGLVLAPGQAGAVPSGWTITPSPSPDSNNPLLGVSCASPTYCVAVGLHSGSRGHEQTLVETWDGTSWSVTPSPNPGTKGSELSGGVSCASTTFCVAVGFKSNDGNTFQTLVETWNGTNWSVTPSPNLSTDNFLKAISCASPTYCVAVGGALPSLSSSSQTLILTWNGTSWSVTSSPNPSQNSDLRGVSCTSSTFCVAVGAYNNGNAFQTLVETWDGTNWSITPSPNRGDNNNSFASVSCPSATYCVAVGAHTKPSQLGAKLIETWNGTSWSVTHSPNPNTMSNNSFSGVSCTSATSCVATGIYNKGPRFKTLIESWDGAAWSITPSPNRSGNNFLQGISCSSATYCVTVGYSGFIPTSTLIETGT